MAIPGQHLRNLGTGVEAMPSYTRAFVVTPHDTNEITAQALMVGGDGAVSVQLWNDQPDKPPTVIAMKAGVLYPLAVRLVRSTGTTATSIVALL